MKTNCVLQVWDRRRPSDDASDMIGCPIPISFVTN